MLLYIKEVTLSDNSRVYNLELSYKTLSCVTLADAFQLAVTIKEAIDQHTNEECRIHSEVGE